MTADQVSDAPATPIAGPDRIDERIGPSARDERSDQRHHDVDHEGVATECDERVAQRRGSRQHEPRAPPTTRSIRRR